MQDEYCMHSQRGPIYQGIIDVFDPFPVSIFSQYLQSGNRLAVENSYAPNIYT